MAVICLMPLDWSSPLRYNLAVGLRRVGLLETERCLKKKKIQEEPNGAGACSILVDIRPKFRPTENSAGQYFKQVKLIKCRPSWLVSIE